MGNYLSIILKMWQMAIFIRHICGEQKNTLGHRWSKLSKNSNTGNHKLSLDSLWSGVSNTRRSSSINRRKVEFFLIYCFLHFKINWCSREIISGVLLYHQWISYIKIGLKSRLYFHTATRGGFLLLNTILAWFCFSRP